MTVPIIVTGDDVAIPVQLRRGATGAVAPFAIGGGGQVRARLVSIDHQVTYTEELEQLRAAPGADWDTSLVVVQIAGAATASVTYQGKAKLEIQVSDGGKTTWFVECVIRRGNIA